VNAASASHQHSRVAGSGRNVSKEYLSSNTVAKMAKEFVEFDQTIKRSDRQLDKRNGIKRLTRGWTRSSPASKNYEWSLIGTIETRCRISWLKNNRIVAVKFSLTLTRKAQKLGVHRSLSERESFLLFLIVSRSRS